MIKTFRANHYFGTEGIIQDVGINVFKKITGCSWRPFSSFMDYFTYYHTVVSHQVELIIMQYFTYKEWKMKTKLFYIIVYISSTLLRFKHICRWAPDIHKSKVSKYNIWIIHLMFLLNFVTFFTAFFVDLDLQSLFIDGT